MADVPAFCAPMTKTGGNGTSSRLKYVNVDGFVVRFVVVVVDDGESLMMWINERTAKQTHSNETFFFTNSNAIFCPILLALKVGFMLSPFPGTFC